MTRTTPTREHAHDTRRRTTACALSRAGLVALLACPIGACSSRSTAPPAPPTTRTPTDPSDPAAARTPLPRLDVAFGTPAIIPFASLPGGTGTPPASALLDDTTRVDVAWRWCVPRVLGAGDAATRDGAALQAAGWMGPIVRWSVRGSSAEAGTAPDLAPGFWLAAIALPPGSEARTLAIAGRRYRIRALESPSRRMSPPTAGHWPTSPLRGGDAMLAAAAANPTARWWSRLMADGLRPRVLARAHVGDHDAGPDLDPDLDLDLDRFDDPLLEAWAAQQEEQWRWALDALASADRPLALRLVAALTRAPRLDGVRAPLAPYADPGVDALKSALLDPSRHPRDRIAAAQAWLDTQPDALAWIIDDAGPGTTRDEATPRARVLAMLVNLGPAAAIAWLGDAQDQSPAQASQSLLSIEPQSSVAASVTTDAPETRSLPPSAPTPIARLAAHIGDAIVPLSAFTSAIAVRPPGFEIPALVADWTAAAILASATDGSPRVNTDARGVLERDENDRWVLRLRVLDDPAAEQTVRLWLGPKTADQTPAAEVRLRPGGLEPLVAADGPTGVSTGGSTGGAHVLASRAPSSDPDASTSGPGDAWIIRFTLPRSAIDADDVARLGLELVTREGRFAWPRPMLPWQMEPGRLAVDLGAWDQVGRGK